MSSKETRLPAGMAEKPSKKGERWVDMDTVLRMGSKIETEELLRIWRARREEAKKKKPKLPNHPS